MSRQDKARQIVIDALTNVEKVEIVENPFPRFGEIGSTVHCLVPREARSAVEAAWPGVVAALGAPALAPAERAAVATAKVAASAEVDFLIAIIERLAGEVVPAADGESWTVCLQCKAQIHDPSSFCPECGADIDRQYAGRGVVPAADGGVE